jgi:isoquinoline 1-oxidoreductase beta subunit
MDLPISIPSKIIASNCIQLRSVVPVLAWRSVGHSHTAFVMESLIDELALLGGKDPVDYRRMLLKNHARHLAALNLAAEKSQWDKPLRQGIFRGVAVHAAMGELCFTGCGTIH